VVAKVILETLLNREAALCQPNRFLIVNDLSLGGTSITPTCSCPSFCIRTLSPPR